MKTSERSPGGAEPDVELQHLRSEAMLGKLVTAETTREKPPMILDALQAHEKGAREPGFDEFHALEPDAFIKGDAVFVERSTAVDEDNLPRPLVQLRRHIVEVPPGRHDH